MRNSKKSCQQEYSLIFQQAWNRRYSETSTFLTATNRPLANRQITYAPGDTSGKTTVELYVGDAFTIVLPESSLMEYPSTAKLLNCKALTKVVR
jgi:hypothetical protein